MRALIEVHEVFLDHLDHDGLPGTGVLVVVRVQVGSEFPVKESAVSAFRPAVDGSPLGIFLKLLLSSLNSLDSVE